MHLIDCYAHANRWRKRLPGEKLCLSLGLLALALILPWSGELAVLAVATLAAVAGAGIPPAIWLKVLAIPAVFLVPSAALLTVGVEHAPGGLWRIFMAWDRVGPAAAILLRAFSAAACLNLLAMTTPAYEWVPILRRWRVPGVVLDTMLLVYRMFFLLVERLDVMLTAQASRLGYSNRRRAMRSYGLLAACLLTHAMDRAARMDVCLGARGFNGELPVLPCDADPSRQLRLFTAASFGVVILAGVLGWVAA